MFEALDLSDEQRKQLDEIKKGMEAEFQKFADRDVDVRWRTHEKHLEEYRKLEASETDPQKRMRITLDNRQAVEETVRKANPDLVREMDEVTKSRKELSEQLKIKMFDVLTDEQWNRMLDLIDNPPEYVKKMLAERREREKSASSTGAWQPGPNSWKPGDPIPEGYRQQRSEGRFPRNAPSE